MKRVFILVWVVLTTLTAFGGCGLDSNGGLESDAGGGKGGSAGTGVGGGTCFPGAKVCPDPKTGKLVCLGSNVPENGCQGSTACDPCALQHATAKCSDKGKCVVDTCIAPYADCDSDPTNGCETNLNTDKLHCGSCTLDCTTTQGPGWICDGAGICEVNQCCPDGAPTCVNRQDCDKDKTNGCEVDVGTDTNNCGACGNVCALPHTVTHTCDLTCRVATCEPGWENCDAKDSTGCETHIDADSANCGGCNKVCNSTNGGAACVSAVCQISCNAGYADCNGDVDADGCEINVTNDQNHCGACTNGCNLPNTTGPTCANSACGFSGCVSGFANCDNQVNNGCETNTTNSLGNCGGCNKPCSAPPNATPSCSGSQCGYSCNSGFHQCGDGNCYANSDASHCGGSCTNCPTPNNGTRACSGGSCVANCNSGYHMCSDGNCYGNSDITHCGGSCTNCPVPANGSATCSGSCGITCDSGYHACADNKCYSNSDATHCGGSCTNCPDPSGTGNPTCNSGACGISCSSPTPDPCPPSACVDFNGDNQHCGNCPTNCQTSSTGKTCQSGTCKCPSGTTLCSSDGTCHLCCNPGTHDTCPSPGNNNCCTSRDSCSTSC